MKQILDRFWSKTDLTGPCWNWKAGKDRYGYGEFRFDGKMVRSHRFSYEQYFGKIHSDVKLDHLCRNRGCVNPTHLEIVTSKENTLRGFGPAAKNFKKTHCSRGHEYNEENTIKYENRRHCKTCDIIRNNMRYNK